MMVTLELSVVLCNFLCRFPPLYWSVTSQRPTLWSNETTNQVKNQMFWGKMTLKLYKTKVMMTLKDCSSRWSPTVQTMTTVTSVWSRQAGTSLMTGNDPIIVMKIGHHH